MALLALIPVFTAVPASADIGNDGVFQIDGDVVHTPTGSGDDWRDLFSCPQGAPAGCTATASSPVRSYAIDPVGNSIFTTGGSKDELDIPNWRWTNGNVPDKDNLYSAFAVRYPSNRLYFGADRLANNGDAQIGFWFFQNTVSLNANGTFSGAHDVGDILVLTNFTNGGGAANIQVLKVTAINNGAVSFTTLAAGTAGQNRACNVAGTVCAATNAGNAASLDPEYVPKSGSPSTYPAESFFEGGIDLAALGLGSECFSSFLVETRSSQSITAVLKDFVLGQLQQCQATIATEIHSGTDHDTNYDGQSLPAGSSIHDKVFVVGEAGFAAVGGTATFKFFDNGTCAGTPLSTESNVALTLESPDTGSGAVSSAESSVQSNLAPGSYSYLVTYNGDDPNYPDVQTATCEAVTVNAFSTSINTAIRRVSDGADITNQAIDVTSGSVTVRDEATVTCDSRIPTGFVTFTRYTTGDCSGTGTTDNCGGNGTSSGCALDSNGKALSSTFSLGGATLSYKATYNGDTFCLPSSISKCEPVCGLSFTTSQ